MEDSRPLPQFRCDEIEKQRLFKEWKTWKCALECYFDAYGIYDQQQRRAKLLHLGGPQLQRVFQNLPDRENFPLVSLEKQWYDVAINALDAFFQPYRQDCLERYKLRQIKQKEEERFADFILRLRQQVSDCGFDKYPEDVKEVLTEVFLIDAIIEGCQSQELRRRILQQDRTLAEIEALGVTLEGIDNQVKGFGGRCKQTDADQRVFRIGATQNTIHKRSYPQPGGSKRKFATRDGIKCFNCARRDHISTSETCPARGKVCRTCKIVGHFESCCRSRKFGKAPAEAKKVRAVQESDAVAAPGDVPTESVSKTYYTFHAGNESNVIACNVGGVRLDLLVDSGSDVNLIPDNVWEHLKQEKVIVHQCVKGSDKVLKGYANDKPLSILGSFKANVEVGQKTVQAEFFVIAGGQRSILGDKTAKELGILYVGLHINQVGSAGVPFPKIKDVQVQIHTDPDIKPVFQPVRRIPIPLEAAVDRKLDALLATDIIEVKNGPATWVSPLVVVGKKNGEPRICLDLRRVNQAVLRERHPMPVVEEYLARLGNGKIWSKLDIKDAFLQVELAPESRDVTTFITNKGLFRFKRLPFGLVVAPELFQKVMDQILAGCEGTHWYLDDVIVEGKDKQEHDERLNEVLKRFRDRSVLLNWDKCVFRAGEVDFIGHHISAEGILPSNSKIEAILSFRRPENASEVRSFLGLANYLNRFIPNLATLDEPLRKLIRFDSNFSWDDEHEQAFEQIKAAMANAQSLGFFKTEDRTAVMADASPTGLGALLLQTDVSGSSRIVSCASKSLTETEKKYCQTEKEALAIVWSVERFYTYLYGREFDILTDCKALQYLFTARSRPCARIERWVLRLQAFDYKVIYIPGEKNTADVLSRLGTLTAAPFDPSEELAIRQIALHSATTAALDWREIVKASQEDPEIRDVLEHLEHDRPDELPLSFRIVANELCRCEDVLLRCDRIVIPSALRDRVLCVAHEGHIGMRMMKSHLRSAVWWPKMDIAVENFVKNCRSCTLVSAPDPPVPMIRKDLPYGPWEDIAVDFLGPLPEGQTLFVVVDYYSRFIEVCEMIQTTAKDTILQLSKMFCRYGVPITLRADNGPQLNCEELRNFCDEIGVRLVNTIPYWPQQNGEIERQNRSILKRLKIAQELGQEWRRVLDQYILSYHSTPHPTTGRSPFDLMFGRRMRSKLPQVPREVHLDEETSDHDRLQKEKGRVYADKKRRAKESDIQVGAKVVIKRFRKENKLSTDYSAEEHTVIRLNGADVTLRSLETGKECRRNIVHLKKLPENSPANYNEPRPETSTEEESPKGQETENPSGQDSGAAEPAAEDQDDTNHPRQLLRRERREPLKFQDYLSY